MNKFAVSLMCLIVLSGCASQSEMVKTASQVSKLDSRSNDNFKTVAKALTGIQAKIQELEKMKVAPAAETIPEQATTKKETPAVQSPSPSEAVASDKKGANPFFAECPSGCNYCSFQNCSYFNGMQTNSECLIGCQPSEPSKVIVYTGNQNFIVDESPRAERYNVGK